MPTISTLLNALNARFPFARAESWDKTGLQIGDTKATVSSVFVAYEITDAVLNQAQGFDCLVVYHPLIFRPLENLNFSNHTARLAAHILGAGQHLIAVHTALDGAAPPHALGDALAASLGLENVQVLAASGQQKLVKIGVYVPKEHVEKVSTAMWGAGAGQIGLYDEASFRYDGLGTFRPLEGASPFSGEVGLRSEESEVRLEVVAPEEKWKGIVTAMKAAHPYEEIAFDVTALLNAEENQAYGPARIGEAKTQSLEEFAQAVGVALDPPNIRIVKSGHEVKKVVCSPGAGASFIADAAHAGADVLVCGDIKHHDALQARALGLSVIDVTHAATERATIPLLAEVLEAIEGLQVKRGTLDNPFS